MTLDELKTAWEQDCNIDELNPDRSSARSPQLHSKYLNELLDYRLKLTKTNFEYSQLKSAKARYFRGEMTKEELDLKGWEQWQYKTLRSDIESMIDADPEAQKIEARVEYLKAVITFIESVMSEIRNRSFHCKNIIEWQKFRAGS